MIEIFEDLTDQFKDRVAFIYDMMMRQNGIVQAIKVLKDFSDTCTEEQKEFIDFYLKVQMEKMKNEDNNDQREKRLWEG